MEFQIISDIHLECYDECPPMNQFITPSAKNLILAGDICYAKNKNLLPFFSELSNNFDNIIYILGNHEYYCIREELPVESFDSIEYFLRDRLKHLKNVIILNKNSIVLNGVAIIGTTLWSYSKLTKSRKKYIKKLPNGWITYKNHLNPNWEMINEFHIKQKLWLENEIDIYHNKYPIVVVTHYLPTIKCVDKKYLGDEDNDQFCSDCEYMVKISTVWISGHTHTPCLVHVDSTPVFVNPVGNPNESKLFDKKLIFKINSHL